MSGSPPRPDQPPDPDQRSSTRPVRVVRFDGFSAVDHDPDEGAGGPPAADPDRQARGRVADLDGLAAAGPAPSRTAAFDALDAPRAAAAPVAAFDALATRPRDRPGGAPAAGGPVVDGRAAGPAVDGRAAGPAVDGRAAGPADADVPPDGPLPRGRRRRARVGRLGPDGPDPDVPEREADPVAVAREICLRLLTDRARTRQELAQALARKGVPAEAASTVLDRFDEVGLIDDAAFAGQWVRSRHAVRGLGRRAIAVELRRKGVADDVAGEALAEVDADAEARRARELVDRKLRSTAVDTADERAAAGRRLVGMLARKGYGAGIAYRVVREALAERGAEADELGAAEPHDD